MKIYIVTLYCNDWPENGGGFVRTFRAFTNRNKAEEYAKRLADEWTADAKEKEGYYEGCVDEIELIEDEDA